MKERNNAFFLWRPRLSIRLSVCVVTSLTETVCRTFVRLDTEFVYKKSCVEVVWVFWQSSNDSHTSRRGFSELLLSVPTTFTARFSWNSVPETCSIVLLNTCEFRYILYNEPTNAHNYFTNYHTATCFDTVVSSSDSLQSTPCQVTQVFQMQLSVIQFTVKMFHIHIKYIIFFLV
jgi:hypothetical protein